MPRAARLVSGTVNVNVLLAFAFGAIAAVALLLMSIFITEMSAVAQTVVIAVLALAAAGVGAVIPGMLHVEFPFAKASGALALFLVVWFTQPAILDTAEEINRRIIDPPPHPNYVEETRPYLSLYDEGNFGAAWELLDDRAKLIWPEPSYTAILTNTATQLGPPDSNSRILVNTNAGVQLEGLHEGTFYSGTYLTRYENSCQHEQIVLRLQQDGTTWKPYQHMVFPVDSC
ncbi:DUF4019 domain-containing protein [Devosia sp. CAU 1758]